LTQAFFCDFELSLLVVPKAMINGLANSKQNNSFLYSLEKYTYNNQNTKVLEIQLKKNQKKL
jgi:hypothetical protein